MEPIDNSSPEEENEYRDPDDSPNLSSSDPAAPEGFYGSGQGSFQEAWDYLRAGFGSGSELNAPSSVEQQQALLTEWARQTDRAVQEDEIRVLPVVSDDTSEHKVYFRASDERAVKPLGRAFTVRFPWCATAIWTENQQLRHNIWSA